MEPPTEKTIWRNRAEKKTKALVSGEARLRHYRRSDLTKYAIKRNGGHEKLARERHSDRFGDADDTEKALAAADKRRKLNLQRRRRRERALAVVIEEIQSIRKEASPGTEAEKIDYLRRLERAYEKKKNISFKLDPRAAMVAGPDPELMTALSTLWPMIHKQENVPETARSAPLSPTTTKQFVHSNQRFRNRIHPGVSSAVGTPRSDVATPSSSQARQNSVPLPSVPSILVNPANSLSRRAISLDSPLSAAHGEHIRKRMKSWKNSPQTLRSKRVKGMIPSSLRSVSVSSDPSINSTEEHVKTAEQALSRPQGEAMSLERDRCGSTKERRFAITASEKHKRLGEGSMETVGSKLEKEPTAFESRRHPRARRTHSDNSFFKTTRNGDGVNKIRRIKSVPSSWKTHYDRLVHVGGGPGDVAHFPPAQKLPVFTKGHASVDALPRTVATSQQHQSLALSKEAKSVNHYREARPSRRRYQLRDTTTATRRKRQYLGRLRSSVKHTTVTKKQDRPSGGRTGSPCQEKRVGHTVSGKDVAKKFTVQIPSDRDMATELRSYSQWPDDTGALKNAHGCLLPAKYRFSDYPGFEWICPIRTCRRCFQSQRGLGSHFASAHHSCLLNDNCDGTFTIVGKYTRSHNDATSPALVKSKNPLPDDAPPMVEPRAPATTRQQDLFSASQKKASLHPTPHANEEKTVDEMMLSSSCFVLSSAEASGHSELSDLSRTSSFQDSERRSYEPKESDRNELKSPPTAKPGARSTALTLRPEEHRHGQASPAPHDATQENWRLVRKFITGKQFYPPKRGHFAALLSTARARDIVTRPGTRFVADQPKKVRLLMVHMTGEEPSVPCNSCARGRGPFKKCVAVSQKAAVRKRNLQRKCNVEELLGQLAVGQIGPQRKQQERHPAAESKEKAVPGINAGGVQLDGRFTFAVHALPLDGSLDLDADPSGIRLCSLTAGKLLVEVEGNSPFLIGPHGVFKLAPGVSAEVSNASEVDAVLHVSTVKT